MDTFSTAVELVETTLENILNTLSGNTDGTQLEDYAVQFQGQLTIIYNDILKLSKELRESWRSPAIQTRIKELFMNDAKEDIGNGLNEWKKGWELHSVTTSKIKATVSLEGLVDTE